MSFIQRFCGPLSAQANTDFPKIWGYRNEDDSITEMVTPGYFNPMGSLINDGDYLQAHCSEGALFGMFHLDQNTWTVDVLIGSNYSSMRFDPVLIGSSSAIQTPPGLDQPIPISFGPAQSNDYIGLDATGAVTFLRRGTYQVRIRLQIGRTGNPGTAFIFARGLVNGVQLGSSVYTRLDDSDNVIPETFETQFNIFDEMQLNDTLTLELYRDSAGIDAGGLYPASPAISSWADAPSAEINISRLIF